MASTLSRDSVTLSLARLAAKDSHEVARLVEAAHWPGYFYLDLADEPAAGHVAEQVREVYALAETYFDQPRDTKAKDAREGLPASSDRGYKCCETDESFEISTDELRRGTLKLPAVLAARAALVESFQTGCQAAAGILLDRFAEALALPLRASHRPEQPSESGLKLIAEPTVPLAAHVVENKHRDSGSLTLLFYQEPGVQVCLSGREADDRPPQEQQWVFVPPPPAGCALVHGGNALERLSAGRLTSPLHRVTQAADGAGKRYFLSFFLRPEHRLQDEWAAAA